MYVILIIFFIIQESAFVLELSQPSWMSLVSPFIYISSLGLTGTKLVSHFQVNIPWAERSAIKAVGEKLSVTLSRLVQGLTESFLSMNVISLFFVPGGYFWIVWIRPVWGGGLPSPALVQISQIQQLKSVHRS